MELYEAITKRKTTREFLDKEVDLEAIKRILGAGNKAPTWDHNRNWQFIVLRTDEEKEYAFSEAKAIVERAKGQCNLIWLENLNLRGGYKTVIMDYIREKHPGLLPLYQEIYNRNGRRYWELLDAELQAFAAEIGLDYVTNDDSMSRPFEAPPILVNFFYHSEIKKSAQKGEKPHA